VRSGSNAVGLPGQRPWRRGATGHPPRSLRGRHLGRDRHIVDPKTFRKVDRINVIPDKHERESEIAVHSVKLGYFLAIRALIGEGHDVISTATAAKVGSTQTRARSSRVRVAAADERRHMT